MTTRREFLAASAAAGLGLTLGACAGDGTGEATEEAVGNAQTASRPLDLLFLGGTAFLGPAQVEYALARGHNVTLFNRGQTNPELFPGVEKLVGDRSVPDYSAMEGRRWDAVIDNSANVATWLRDAAQALQDSTDRYLFVSSISAHMSNATPGQTDDGETFSREAYQEVVESGAPFGEAFGPNKAEAERITFETFGERGIVVRPGLIVGPGDGSDRFTYWPVRIHRGGEVLAPGDGSAFAQIVDVRDLGRFMVHLVEQQASGTFNATGPAEPMTIAAMLEGIMRGVPSDATLTWVPTDFLQTQEVAAWTQLPVYFYPGEDTAGFFRYDCSKAIAAGLTFRPVEETARDTVAWWNGRPAEEQRDLRFGLSAEREAELLAEWHATTG